MFIVFIRNFTDIKERQFGFRDRMCELKCRVKVGNKINVGLLYK